MFLSLILSKHGFNHFDHDCLLWFINYYSQVIRKNFVSVLVFVIQISNWLCNIILYSNIVPLGVINQMRTFSYLSVFKSTYCKFQNSKRSLKNWNCLKFLPHLYFKFYMRKKSQLIWIIFESGIAKKRMRVKLYLREINVKKIPTDDYQNVITAYRNLI